MEKKNQELWGVKLGTEQDTAVFAVCSSAQRPSSPWNNRRLSVWRGYLPVRNAQNASMSCGTLFQEVKIKPVSRQIWTTLALKGNNIVERMGKCNWAGTIPLFPGTTGETIPVFFHVNLTGTRDHFDSDFENRSSPSATEHGSTLVSYIGCLF